MDTVLYVGNLPKTTSENELRNLLSQVGEVTSLTILKDGKSGESKDYGYLAMSSQSEADYAVSRFNDYSVGGHRLRVSLARPRGKAAAGPR